MPKPDNDIGLIGLYWYFQSPKSDKAKLISRMAKMGQPMLPQMSGAIPAQPDSEEEAVRHFVVIVVVALFIIYVCV